MDMLCFIVLLSFVIGTVAACIYAIGTGRKKGKAEKSSANRIKRMVSKDFLLLNIQQYKRLNCDKNKLTRRAGWMSVLFCVVKKGEKNHA